MPWSSRLIINAVLVFFLLLPVVSSCGGSGRRGDRSGSDNLSSALPERVQPHPGDPDLLLHPPADRLLPGEELDGQGHVIPRTAGERGGYPHGRLATGPRRSLASIAQPGLMVLGRDSFTASGNQTTIQETALQLDPLPDSPLVYAIYRFATAGQPPTQISLDLMGMEGDYWIGLADYTHQRWEWHGPFELPFVRLNVDPSLDHTSPLGNAFVMVVSDRSLTILDVGVETRRAADLDPPPQPTGLTAESAAGSVFIRWDPVSAPDLAGYRIYLSPTPFNNASEALPLPTLIPSPYWVVEAQGDSAIYARVAAVDDQGNESPLSELASASPGPGEFNFSGFLDITPLSIITGSQVTITHPGLTSASLDWDVGGDGMLELSDTTQTTIQTTVDQPGVVRVFAMEKDAQGMLTGAAVGALISTENLPPQAVASSWPEADRVYIGELGSVELSWSAQGSSDPEGGPLEYAFDPLGDGSFGPFGPSPDFTHTYSQAGSFTPTIAVRDDIGQQSTVEFPPLEVLRFHSHTVDDGADEFAMPGRHSSLAMVAGMPAVAYYDGKGRLFYARAIVPTPSSSSDWQIHQVDTSPQVGNGVEMAVLNDRPVLCYYDTANSALKFARATTPTPSSSADWVTMVVDNSGNVGNPCSIAIVGGRPVISYYDNSIKALKFAYPTSAEPNSSDDWQSHYVDTTGVVGSPNKLIALANRPVIAYYDQTNQMLKFAAATRTFPQSSIHWGIHVVDSDPALDLGFDLDLAKVGSVPMIAYRAKVRDQSPPDPYLRVALGRSTFPENSSDWVKYDLDSSPDDPDSYVGTGIAITSRGGKPLIAYPQVTVYHFTDPQGNDAEAHIADLKFAQSYRSQPHSMDPWYFYRVDLNGGDPAVRERPSLGLYPSIALTPDGRPAITHYDQTGTALRYSEARLD